MTETPATPTFIVLIGSIGRDSLRASLDSIARQTRLPGDQVIVAFDALGQSAEALEARLALVHSYGAGFLACAHVGHNQDLCDKELPTGEIIPPGQPYHWLGVEQINFALRTLPITGSHVFTIGDDDVFVDGAYETIRETCAEDPERPVLYRFLSPARDRLWDKPRMRGCLISGCCIAAPRRFVPLHPTMISTMHDYFWMEAILAAAHRAGKAPVWLDYVGVIARPPDGYHRGVATCRGCRDGWGYVEDGATHCGYCGGVLSIDARVVAAVPQED